MCKSEIIEAIIEYFNENEDVFNDCMEELDSYNGYLGYAVESMSDNRQWIDSIDDNEELSELFDKLDETENDD